ncbi:MAG: hypothetical protein AAF429_11130 [Pseudomonadota bacterium]
MKISLTLHGSLIALALFGGPLFSAKSDDAFEVSQVAIISAEEFAEMNNTTPAEPKIQNQTDPVAVETPAELDDPVGASDLDDLGIASDVEQQGRIENTPAEIAKPQQADRVSNEVFKAPEEPAPTSTEQAATQDTSEPVPEQPEEQEQSAVRETTTEIVTEAEQNERFVNPIKSIRPKGRPKDLALKQTEEPEPAVTNQTASDDIADLLSDAIAEDQSQQQAEPLSGVELRGLVFAVQQCWNVPIGMQNAEANTVVMGISLNPDGSISGEPRKVEPLASNTQIDLAFETARRALIRCQPYALPPEKYESWKEMEIVFNPAKMVQR